MASFLWLMLFWAKLEADGSRGEARCEPAAPPRPCAPAAAGSPRSRWRDASPAPRCRPPCGSSRTHTAATAARAAGTLRAATPGVGRAAGAPRGPCCRPGEQPRGSRPSLGTGQRPRSDGSARGGGLTFRSAGNSSFFTSPVAAAMLPAPENAASPSWDACSFAFSATARAGGARQCPPVPGRGTQPHLRAPDHPGGSGGESLGRIGPSPRPTRVLGRGPGLCPAAGQGAPAAPQILPCQPRYIRGFSPVTSAPQLASDLVSATTV